MRDFEAGGGRLIVPHPYLAAITYSPRGGGVAAVARLLRQVLVDRYAHDCRLVTLLDDRDDLGSLQASTLTRVRFGTRLAQAQLAGDCSWLFYSHLGLSRVQAYIPPVWRRPYAVFIHGVEAWRALTPVQQQILNGAGLRVANSRLTAHRLAEANPGVGPIAVCPLALAHDFAVDGHHRVEEAPLGIGSKAVVLVARMMAGERYKGHDELLAAWPAVRAEVPDARLVFVGDGDDVERLRARARDLGIADAVVFTGFVADDVLRQIYQRAAVFAMPSTGDGFGLVYLEAMAHGLPCIGSIHDAAGEIIRDGETGFLVEQSDTSAIAARLLALLRDDNRRVEMGQSGHRRWREHFSYEQFARRMLDLIESTLTGSLEHRQAC